MTDASIGATGHLVATLVVALAASGATYAVVDSRILGPVRDRWQVLADKRAGRAEDRLALPGIRRARRAVTRLAASLWAAGGYVASCSWCAGAWVTAGVTATVAGRTGLDWTAGVMTWLAAWWLVGLGAAVVDLIDVRWQVAELQRKQMSGGAGGPRS